MLSFLNRNTTRESVKANQLKSTELLTIIHHFLTNQNDNNKKRPEREKLHMITKANSTYYLKKELILQPLTDI